MINTSIAYEDYVVFVDSKALRGRSKAEYLRQVRKLGARYPERSLKQISERIVFDHLIQSTSLGHSKLTSTLIYLHVTEISESRGREVQQRLLHYALRS